VLVAATDEPGGDQLWGKLPVLSWHRQELGPEDALGRAALVRVDVRGLGADDCLVPAEQQPESEDVGSAAVQDKVRITLGP
jgi:hypothetical protein